jgi:hypothetical protein
MRPGFAVWLMICGFTFEEEKQTQRNTCCACQEEQQGNYWKRDKWAMHIVESSPSCAPLCRGTGPVQRL